MQQVIINLISNSIRYSAKDRGNIVVGLEKKAKDFIISVKDDGIGIAEGFKPRIFERFARADNAQHTGTESSGLGLYLTRLIMKTVGGQIWFESQEGVGSTFYVSIPTEGMKKKSGDKGLILCDSARLRHFFTGSLLSQGQAGFPPPRE